MKSVNFERTNQMADNNKYPDPRDMIDRQLGILEHLAEQEDRIMSSMTSNIPKELSDSREAKALFFSIEALKRIREGRRRRLIHMHDALKTNENIKIKSKSKNSKEVEGDQRQENPNRKRIRYTTEQCDECGEEAATNVSDQLKHRAPDFEMHLYHLLTQLIDMIHGSTEEVTCYGEFESCLKWLNKDSGNKIVQAVLDLLNEVKKQAGKLGSLVQKVEKGGLADELLDQLLGNIQSVACLLEQSTCAKQDIYLLCNLIEECGAQQMAIESKINALKMRNLFKIR